MTQTPTDPIRDEAVKVLAEALHAANGSSCLHETGYEGTGWVQCDQDAAWIVKCSPTLARRLALGTALDASGTIDVGAALAAKLGGGK